MTDASRLNTAREPAQAVQETEVNKDRSPSLNSDALLQGQKAVTISHNGSLYRLQATRQGKLILTK